MTPIKVDVDALADMGRQLISIKDDFDHVSDVTKDAGEYAGNHAIAAALADFTANWSDKRQQISALLGTTAESVTAAARAYHRTDHDVARHAGGHHHAGDAAPHRPGCTCGCAGDAVGTAAAHAGDSGGAAPAAGTAADGGSYVPASYDAGSYDPGAYGSGPSDTTTYGGGNDVPPADGGMSEAAPTISGTGSVADDGSVGMSAEAAGGGDGGSGDSGGGPGATSMAAAAAPIGLLGAAGAAAWAAQKRRDGEQNSDDESDE